MRDFKLPGEAALLALAETPLREARGRVPTTRQHAGDLPRHNLVYDDNGYQQFFADEELLLFNPRFGAFNATEQLSYGWQAARRHAGNWHAVLDSVPHRDLHSAKALTEAHLGVSLTLQSAPEGAS